MFFSCRGEQNRKECVVLWVGVTHSDGSEPETATQLQVVGQGTSLVRKEVIWWMITVVLVEVVPPADGRRAVRSAATVSNQVARSV